MSVIENEFTEGIMEFYLLSDGRILTYQYKGIISLWKYTRPKQLQHVGHFEGDVKILKMVPYTEETFISINNKCEIRIWETDSGRCKMTLPGRPFYCVDKMVVLPDDLLVVAGYCVINWGCFDVWDLKSGKCIHQKKQFCKNPGVLHLKTTTGGWLLVAGTNLCVFSIWMINRFKCELINRAIIDKFISMTVLPTGELIFTYDSSILFYKISVYGGIYHYKTLHGRSGIDIINPVAGYKLLIINQYKPGPGTIILWNYISDQRKILDSSRYKDETSKKHIILEKKGAVLSCCTNKIILHEFSENIFRFPRQLAEARKNARVLAQAQRTGNSLFSKLPKEVILSIISFTSGSKDQYVNAVSAEVIQNYFCKPMTCED